MDVTVEGLASMPPGPELAAALTAVDLSRCSSVELFALSEARARQASFDQSHLLETLLECAYAERADALSQPGAMGRSGVQTPSGQTPTRVRDLDEFSGDQLSFTLNWSRSAMFAHLLLARDLIERLPLVFAALRAGRIDLARARAFSAGLWGLDDDKARGIVAKLIIKAENWTPGNLRQRLRYHVLRADPGLARKRYQRSVADRRVTLQATEEGTAVLTATNLPPDRAAAAHNRVERLARAARRAGDSRNLCQLRADVLLDLVSGRPFLLAPSRDSPTAAADHIHRDQGIGDPKPSDEDDDGRYVVIDPEPIGVGAFEGGAAPAVGEQLSEVPRGSGDAHNGRPTGGPEPVPVAADDPRLCVCGGLQPAPRRGVVDLQIKLTTLMGLDNDPGLIDGFGPVIAEIARAVATDREANPAWKYSVTDEQGRLLHHGHIRRRPKATENAFVKARDRTCQAPSCHAPAADCDGDHRQEWSNNGPSHRGNIDSTCRHHHRLRHERGYRTERRPDGSCVWHAPNGMRYTVPVHATLNLIAEEGTYTPRHAATEQGEPCQTSSDRGDQP